MPLNVELTDANFSLGPDSGFFYSCSFSLQQLLKVEADGDLVGSFPVSFSTFRTPIKELHFDGTFFWTLEDLPSDLGIVIKKWRLFPFPTAAFPSAIPIELRWQDELTLIHAPNIRWQSDAFAIEHYHRTFNGSFLQGVNTIRLNDVSNISPGTKLYLGPSGFGGFVGNEEEITVLSVNPTTKDVTFGKLGGLENSYLSLDPLDFQKNIILFNDHSFGGSINNRGSLINFVYPGKFQTFSDIGGKYGAVTAADFYANTLSWVKSFQILEINLNNPTFDLSTSQESNLVQDDGHTLITVFDMISDLGNSQYLKLQDRETTPVVGPGNFSTTVHAPMNGPYNFQAQPTPSFVNSVSMEFFPGRFLKPLPDINTINITTYVRDQFNFPVLGKTIAWSAPPGTLNPNSQVTNTSGIAETIYTPDGTPTSLSVDVTAAIQ